MRWRFSTIYNFAATRNLHTVRCQNILCRYKIVYNWKALPPSISKFVYWSWTRWIDWRLYPFQFSERIFTPKMIHSKYDIIIANDTLVSWYPLPGECGGGAAPRQVPFCAKQILHNRLHPSGQLRERRNVAFIHPYRKNRFLREKRRRSRRPTWIFLLCSLNIFLRRRLWAFL